MSKVLKLASKWVRSVNALVRFAAYGKHPRRGALLVAFVRLHLTIALYGIAMRPLGSFSVLGRRMQFASPRTFSILLMELFIEESYGECNPPPRTILDLGSNIGMSILLFKSLWPTCRVLGVEASPQIFAILQQNIQGLPDVTVVNRAVSDRAGTISFYSAPDSLMGSTDRLRGGGGGSSVEAVPLSAFVTGPVDLLKIDIEGSEVAAFAELEASGKMALIQEMRIEYHHHVPGERHSLAAFLERLERHGFGYELGAVLPDEFGGMQDLVIRARRIESGAAG
jgi:FkbM family methyltransferase